MGQLFRLHNAVKRDPAVDAWLAQDSSELRAIAGRWFDVIRSCGDDVNELVHDGGPTACVADAAFAYVNAFSNHVNVGFFSGADLPDPFGLLQGTGRFMRHVKVGPGHPIDEGALVELIEEAYKDIRRRIG